MFTVVAEKRPGDVRRARPALAGIVLRIKRRLAPMLAAALLAAATSPANAGLVPFYRTYFTFSGSEYRPFQAAMVLHFADNLRMRNERQPSIRLRA